MVGILFILSAFSLVWRGQTSFLPITDVLNSASKTTISYVWHIITVENLVFGMAFLVMSVYKDLSKVKFTAWIIAVIMVARCVVIFGSTLFSHTKGVVDTLTESIVILVMVGLIMLGTRKNEIENG